MDVELVPKIADFGMGKIVGDEDADATVSVVVGTLGYIAPGKFNNVWIHFSRQWKNFVAPGLYTKDAHSPIFGYMFLLNVYLKLQG
jgi:serine/threonine protein kinase